MGDSRVRKLKRTKSYDNGPRGCEGACPILKTSKTLIATCKDAFSSLQGWRTKCPPGVWVVLILALKGMERYGNRYSKISHHHHE